MDDKAVTFRYRDNATGGQKSMTLDGGEFLRRFLLHVLPTGFVRIRYYGLLANRYRAQNLKRCRALLGTLQQAAATPSRSQATEPRPTDEHRRGQCTVCGVGQLVVVRSLAPVVDLDLTATVPVARDTS